MRDVPALRLAMMNGGLALCCALAFACGPTARPDGGSGLLGVGATAPDVTGTDAKGAPIRLSDVKGKPAIVYFYPRDETPGCTKEACAFRDAFTRFESAGVVVFGVSRDSEASHREFREHHKLPFPLVADEAGKVQAAYGVPSKMPGIAARVSFLVGRDGKIAHVWPEVDPVLHATEVLTAAQQLGG
jgi:peroxiredoxin Q/BCP